MFRYLYEALVEYSGNRMYEEVLQPHLDDAVRTSLELEHFRYIDGRPKEEVFTGGDFPVTREQATTWELYALGRVSDFLLLSFQGEEAFITEQQYAEFFTRLGFTPFKSDIFTPFEHEICQVEQTSDPGHPIQVEEVVWPGLRYGDMMFSRSGVSVSGGSHVVLKDVAETSTLYFAFRRANRPTEDLSMGWGHNSQWRTAWRRDYQVDGRLYYNVAARAASVQPERDGLTPAERRELCRHRCFIRCTKPHADLWPYDDYLEELMDPPGSEPPA